MIARMKGHPITQGVTTTLNDPTIALKLRDIRSMKITISQTRTSTAFQKLLMMMRRMIGGMPQMKAVIIQREMVPRKHIRRMRSGARRTKVISQTMRRGSRTPMMRRDSRTLKTRRKCRTLMKMKGHRCLMMRKDSRTQTRRKCRTRMMRRGRRPQMRRRCRTPMMMKGPSILTRRRCRTLTMTKGPNIPMRRTKSINLVGWNIVV